MSNPAKRVPKSQELSEMKVEGEAGVLGCRPRRLLLKENKERSRGRASWLVNESEIVGPEVKKAQHTNEAILQEGEDKDVRAKPHGDALGMGVIR